MNFPIQLDENTILNYIEDYNTNDDGEITVFEMHFDFFNNHYTVHITADHLKDEDNVRFIQVEGPSILHDSFNEHYEDLWDVIRQRCNEFNAYYNELNRF